MLDKITIIIPSFQRKYYLKKNINYWKNSKVKIIILDGSKEKLQFENCDSYQNIKYLHLPKKNLFERLGLASQLIETEYGILCCDDELYLENGLLACVEELEKNKDLSCAMGRVLCFRYRGNKKKLVGFSGYNQFKNYYLNYDDPLQRVKMHMANGMGRPTMYSLTRSIYLREILRLVSKSNQFPCQQTYELQSDICLAYYGKIKFVEKLTWLRNFDEQPLWPRGKHFFEKWYLNKDFKKDVEKLLFMTSESLYSIDKRYELPVISKMLDEVLMLYSSNKIKTEKTLTRVWSGLVAPKIISFVKKIISDDLIYTLKKKFFSELDIFLAAEKLKNTGVNFEKKELEKAVKVLND